MKKAFLAVIFALFMGSSVHKVCADEVKDQDLQRWEIAYSGNFSLAHKLYLSGKRDSLDEKILNLFYLAYAYYKNKDPNNAMYVFNNVDLILKEPLRKYYKINNCPSKDLDDD